MTQTLEKKAYFFGPIVFAGNSKGSIDITSIITEDDAIDKILNGQHRGLSPEIKIKFFKCSICNQDYENCEHEENKRYDEKLCEAMPSGLEFLSVSIVDTPKDPRARINDMLIIEKTNKETTYTWHGFETEIENRRFKHIQKAVDSKFISEKLGLKFSTFFMDNFIGTLSLR